jgi:hypothetical protein
MKKTTSSIANRGQKFFYAYRFNAAGQLLALLPFGTLATVQQFANGPLGKSWLWTTSDVPLVVNAISGIMSIVPLEQVGLGGRGIVVEDRTASSATPAGRRGGRPRKGAKRAGVTATANSGAAMAH